MEDKRRILKGVADRLVGGNIGKEERFLEGAEGRVSGEVNHPLLQHASRAGKRLVGHTDNCDCAVCGR